MEWHPPARKACVQLPDWLQDFARLMAGVAQPQNSLEHPMPPHPTTLRQAARVTLVGLPIPTPRAYPGLPTIHPERIAWLIDAPCGLGAQSNVLQSDPRVLSELQIDHKSGDQTIPGFHLLLLC